MSDFPDLGPCCACGLGGPDCNNVMMLEVKAPVPGTGWGCAACYLPLDGAVAVLCEACLAEGRDPVEVADGYLIERRRAPMPPAWPVHAHDRALHALDDAAPAHPGRLQ